jgi:hypothetical protein
MQAAQRFSQTLRDGLVANCFDNIQLGDSDYTPYFYFRSQSEQDRQKDPEWQ